MRRKALFLDRDGVINVEKCYVHKREDFEFMPGIFDLVRIARHMNYKVIVVTNQAGIGRGYYTEEQFHDLMDWMCGQFELNGGHIDAVYFCPFHPEFGIGNYKRQSDCRKPAPGMLIRAQKEHGVNFQESILVGDKLSDIAAGRAVGVGTLLYLNGEPLGGYFKQISALTDVIPFLS